MKNSTLGLSFGYHDSSAAIAVNGKLVAAAAEERFTRQKHDSNFPVYAIDFCLKEAGLTMSEIDQVVYHEDLAQKFSRVLASSISVYPFSLTEFCEAMKSWLGKKLWTLNDISKRLDIPPKKIKFLSHHLSHAAGAFLSSPFESAGILVVDAVGEWTSTALYSGHWTEDKPVINKILEISFPHSLGLIYSAITSYLGFNPNSEECSTMALAAFGKPIYLDKFKRFVTFLPDGTYQIDDSYFNFRKFYQSSCSKKFTDLFGPARKANEKINFSCFDGITSPEITDRDRHFANMASTIQLLFEESILRLVKVLREKTKLKNLCIAGGGALNCVANSKVIEAADFENYFIPPDPGDGGSAIGAAMLVNCFESKNGKNLSRPVAYTGKAYDEQADVEMLAFLKPERFAKYKKLGIVGKSEARWDKWTAANEESLVGETSSLLKQGLIIGWVQGPFELGPRALGNRSILLDPSRVDLALRLSSKIKDRAPFRPYGLSTTLDQSFKMFQGNNLTGFPYKWMQASVEVKNDFRNVVLAAIHVDGSTRPQICTEEDNPILYRLLKAFGRLTGVEALLNTSFNEAGYPLVASPALALAMFIRTDLDALVINRTIIRKVPVDEK